MSALAGGAAIGLAAAVALLAVTIVVLRVVSSVRRGRRRELRPRVELALATFLVGEGGSAPAPATRVEREVLQAVALDALMELRGAERARVATLLERLGYVDAAVSALGARRRADRRRAAELLALAGSDAAVPALTAGLADRDPIVRGTCARALAEIGGEDVVPAILGVVERDAVGAPGEVAATVLALGTSRPAAVGGLLGPEVEPKLRAVAAAVAGELRLAEHAPALRMCLEAREDEVAARAARGLGLIGDADAVPRLVRLVAEEHRTPFVRAAAATALGAIGDAAAVPALERELHADDWALRASAAAALALLGDSGGAALRRAAGSAGGDARAQVRAVLER